MKLQNRHDKNLSTHPLGTDFESSKCWYLSLVCDNVSVHEQMYRFATLFVKVEAS